MKILLAALILTASVAARADDAAPAAAAPAAPAAAVPADAAPTVKVDKLTLTSGIKERQPIDESATFPAGFPVYAWAKFSVANPPATVKYVWSADGKKVLEYSVDIKSANGRWWATKKVWPGAWKVEIQSDKGDSLATADFTVTAAAAKPDAPAEATKSDAPASSAPAAPAAPAAGGR